MYNIKQREYHGNALLRHNEHPYYAIDSTWQEHTQRQLRPRHHTASWWLFLSQFISPPRYFYSKKLINKWNTRVRLPMCRVVDKVRISQRALYTFVCHKIMYVRTYVLRSTISTLCLCGTHTTTSNFLLPWSVINVYYDYAIRQSRDCTNSCTVYTKRKNT